MIISCDECTTHFASAGFECESTCSMQMLHSTDLLASRCISSYHVAVSQEQHWRRREGGPLIPVPWLQHTCSSLLHVCLGHMDADASSGKADIRAHGGTCTSHHCSIQPPRHWDRGPRPASWVSTWTNKQEARREALTELNSSGCVYWSGSRAMAAYENDGTNGEGVNSGQSAHSGLMIGCGTGPDSVRSTERLGSDVGCDITAE